MSCKKKKKKNPAKYLILSCRRVLPRLASLQKRYGKEWSKEGGVGEFGLKETWRGVVSRRLGGVWSQGDLEECGLKDTLRGVVSGVVQS